MTFFGNYTSSILLFTGIVVLFVIAALCFSFNSKHEQKHGEPHSPLVIIARLACFACIGLLFFLPGTLLGDYNESEKCSKSIRYETALSSGYEVYIDGALIDGTKIDVNQYRMTINEDNKEIYLAPRTQNAHYETVLRSGFKVYVNGILTDGTKVDLNHYNMTIDEDNKEIYLSSKD